MKRILFYSLFLSFFMFSCGNDDNNEIKSEDNPVETVEVEKEEWKKIAVLTGGFKFGIDVPAEHIANGNEELIYHEDRGELEIKVGSNFNLIVIEDESQMEMVKNEIHNHAFYKAELTLENDSALIYRFYSEDGSKEEWHMYSERNLGSSILLIRSNDDEEFSEFEIKKMMKSTASISPF